MTAIDNNLNQLFLALNQWSKSKHAVVIDNSSCDQLAQICLKIICILVNNNQLGKTISRHLSLMFDIPKELNYRNELINSFKNIEENLEDNLRGFSNLLDFVLQEDQVQRMPAVILDQIDNLSAVLSGRFNQLAKQLEVYLDLEEAFLLKTPKAAVVLFVLALADIYIELTQLHKLHCYAIIARWLKQRVRDTHLYLLYKNSLRMIIKKPMELGKDLLIIMLCLRIAHGDKILATEAAWLDRLLISAGMLGLQPLLDAGFLAVENSAGRGILLTDKSKLIQVK